MKNKTVKKSARKTAAKKPAKTAGKQAGEIAVGIAGCGRMGRAIIAACAADSSVLLKCVFVEDGDALVGKSVDGAPPCVAASAFIKNGGGVDIDALIDFTAPAAAVQYAAACARRRIAFVTGTTGFTAKERAVLQRAGKTTAVLAAQNMSVGVNAAYAVAAAAAKILRAGKLGGGYDMEIFEAHHRHKQDAPSGTALRFGETLARATGGKFSANAVLARQGRGLIRKSSDIGFSVLRGGDIVGEHKVVFAGAGEQLEIVHRSTSRANYAAGALRAAKFAAGAKPGFYDGMEAVFSAS